MRVKEMNDYGIGAMEALSWAYSTLKKCDSLESFQDAREDLKQMILRLASGAAVSFRDKSESIREL